MNAGGRGGRKVRRSGILRRIRWGRVALVVAAPAAVILLVMFLPRLLSPPGRQEGAAAQAAFAPVPPAAPPLIEERTVVPRGSNLAALLKGQGFDNREIHRLKESVKPVYDLGKILSGHELRLSKTPEGRWTSLEYDIDDTRYLSVRNDLDGIRSEVRSYPFEVRTAVVWGVIETSPVAAMSKIGEADVLAYDLAERCFGWDIDFYQDLRRGDTFRILVEKKYLNGEFTGYRNILAAEFVNAGRVHQAFRFTYPDSGASDYFDETGGSKRKEFLRSPFKFTPRITSRFSGSRLHPIYRVYRPHYGVDYGAPVGTPVQATADGKVTFAGWDGGSGRMVRIQHKSQYETLYLHLSGFGPGIRVGAEVKGGQVIGYVGSSGDSTGPHLDYRINFHGSPINPLGQKFQPAEPLRKDFLKAFAEEAAKLRAALDAPRLFTTSVLSLDFF